MKLTRALPLLLVLFLASAASTSPACAWFDTGHEVVASIAYPRLTAAARARVDAILQTDPRGRTFRTASTWPDQIKKRSSGFPRDQVHGEWHFVDMEFSQPTDTPHIPPGENVVTQIPFEVNILGDSHASPQDRADALAWVIHLVGDIHQPLHCSTHITPQHSKGDRGGNDFKLAGDPNELHAYWDNAPSIPPSDDNIYALAAHIEREYPPSHFGRRPLDLDPRHWAIESFRLAEQYPYTVGPDDPQNPPSPPAQYQAMVRTIGRQQVALAGYRLAGLLNRVLGNH